MEPITITALGTFLAVFLGALGKLMLMCAKAYREIRAINIDQNRVMDEILSHVSNHLTDSIRASTSAITARLDGLPCQLSRGQRGQKGDGET